MNHSSFALRDVFEQPKGARTATEVTSGLFERTRWDLGNRAQIVLDSFPGGDGACCCFVRFAPEDPRIVRFVADGIYGWAACPSGGWLLKPTQPDLPCYWLPQMPVFRKLDAHGRILSEDVAPLEALMPTAEWTTIGISTRADAHLDCVLWRFPPAAAEFVTALEAPSTIELQPIFMWASHTSMRGPADVYRFLVHGHVYENRFDWRRKRKICCELEAWSLYVALHGLETATGKASLYRLLKRQIVCSVVARQTPDGGWQHGEWTDFMESHYRFHNAAMHILEAVLEEAPDDVLRRALEKAAAVLATCADRTDIGLWFMHDSLEHSVELTNRSGIRWIPSRELGKSPANKMILNSHLDAIVALDRYRQVLNDARYNGLVESARGAALALLALRPAERLYRALYWAVGLTLLPAREAALLSFPLKVAKRVARSFVIPNLHKVKRRFPRMVMPGGLIERHLSRLHFGTNYHSVNVADLARLWRRFPRDEFGSTIDGAVARVVGSSLPAFWGEVKQKQALGYWVEALYQLSALKPENAYRRYLAEAMLNALDAGLGLPPSLLGAHPELVTPSERIACPSPVDSRLRIANVICAGKREVLAVNPTNDAIELAFEHESVRDYAWTSADASTVIATDASLSVPPRGWLWGRNR